MLEFDAATTRLLDSVYQGADVTRRRRGSFDALRPAPGDTIADVGCGNGLLTAELARAVGPTGRVLGIDPSEAMRSSAKNRCHEYDWVQIMEGEAGQLPVEDASLDKAVSVQVYEYLNDIAAAVAEAHDPCGKRSLGADGVFHRQRPDRHRVQSSPRRFRREPG